MIYGIDFLVCGYYLFQNGEILFVDLTLLRDVRTVCIKDEVITALDVVYHDVTAISYLLVSIK